MRDAVSVSFLQQHYRELKRKIKIYSMISLDSEIFHATLFNYMSFKYPVYIESEVGE